MSNQEPAQPATMSFSFENVIATPSLDLFGISQLDPATYQPPPSPTTATAGKQKKPRKRRSSTAGDKPYPTISCTQCPKTYRDNAAGQRHLALHMTTHDPTAQAKFTCDRCAKTFPNEVYLQRHQNLCGVPRKRRSSVGSSTHDESSNEAAAAALRVDAIEEDGEVQIDFNAF